MERKAFKLSDQLIGQVAKSLQLALLTGTSIVDHFRMFRVEESADKQGELVMTPEYLEHFENNISRMLADVEKLKGEDDECNQTN